MSPLRNDGNVELGSVVVHLPMIALIPFRWLLLLQVMQVKEAPGCPSTRLQCLAGQGAPSLSQPLLFPLTSPSPIPHSQRGLSIYLLKALCRYVSLQMQKMIQIHLQRQPCKSFVARPRLPPSLAIRVGDTQHPRLLLPLVHIYDHRDPLHRPHGLQIGVQLQWAGMPERDQPVVVILSHRVQLESPVHLDLTHPDGHHERNCLSLQVQARGNLFPSRSFYAMSTIALLSTLDSL